MLPDLAAVASTLVFFFFFFASSEAAMKFLSSRKRNSKARFRLIGSRAAIERHEPLEGGSALLIGRAIDRGRSSAPPPGARLFFKLFGLAQRRSPK